MLAFIEYFVNLYMRISVNFLIVHFQVVPVTNAHVTRSGQLPTKGSPVKTKPERKRKRKNDEVIDENAPKGVCIFPQTYYHPQCGNFQEVGFFMIICLNGFCINTKQYC